MKTKNFDYQQIKSFTKVYSKKGCNPYRCFKYYKKRTYNDINYSLQKTFSYINKYYMDFKFSKNMTASEVRNNTNMLINRMCNLDYENKISFSVISSIVLSLIISILIATLQIPIEGIGQNYFEFFNTVLKDVDVNISASRNILELSINVFFYILTFFILSLVIVILVFWLPNLIKIIYNANIYNRTFIRPYEREIVKKTLDSYNASYKFLD